MISNLQVFIILLVSMNYELVEKQYTYREQDPAYLGEPLDRELA